jgi:hypothetical protein
MMSYACHLDFGSRWNEKKTTTTSLKFVVMVLDVATQKKKLGQQAWFWKYLH